MKLHPIILSILVFPLIVTAQKAYESAPISHYESEAVDQLADFSAYPENLEGWGRSGPSSFLEDFDILAS